MSMAYTNNENATLLVDHVKYEMRFERVNAYWR